MGNMVIIDTHLHVYPGYDVGATLRGCAERLTTLAPGAVAAGCLTERHDCHFFKSLLKSNGQTGEGAFRFEILEGGKSVVFRGGRGVSPLFLLPGRQIATRERLEILCIGVDASIPDGEPAALTIRHVREVGGLAVLTWGVGKWLFGRKRVVGALLDEFSPESLLVGDSAMRPTFWPTPSPMRAALRCGYRVLAGTDPQPSEKDGVWAGQYASQLDCVFDPQHPSASLMEGLKDSKVGLRRMGKRRGLIAFSRLMVGGR